MKKLVLMVVAAMMTTMSVNAQSDEPYLKHEIGVSYGTLSNSNWMSFGEALGSSIASFGQCSYNDGRFTGPIALEYYYHVNPVIGVGGVGVYALEKKDMMMLGDKVGDAKNTYISVMPSVKFNWLRKKYFGLYSKVAAGVCFRNQKEEFQVNPTAERQSNSKNSVLFNFQMTGIGIEAGPANIRAFAEFGVGEQGAALIGLRCKF